MARPLSALGLRPGDLVEVRSKQEIFATLDTEGRLDGMPFMPEMLRFCGQRFRVLARAEVSCDTVWTGAGRRVENAVHLEGVRCDGSAHGGCQALCLMWWRERWLRPVETPPDGRADSPLYAPKPAARRRISIDETALHGLTERKGFVAATLYSCQLTRMLDFSRGYRWYDPRPALRQVVSGNLPVGRVVSVLLRAGLNIARRRLGRRPEPHINGRCEGRTPSGRIPGLRSGDWVVVKSKSDIEATLNDQQKNRGLLFDIEMLPYCGRKMRLLQKVDRIIDEKTGAMLSLPNDCWILEGAVCTGYQSRNRLFCTRRIYPFWREIWLQKAEGPQDQKPS